MDRYSLMAQINHWTDRSSRDFLYSIASDFVDQLQERMEEIPMNQTQLARAAKVTKGYVSRIFKNPGNLSLETIVKFARIVGMKVSLVSYLDKSDPTNSNGPVNAEIFKLCWEKQGNPVDMWSFKEKGLATSNTIDVKTYIDNTALGLNVRFAPTKLVQPKTSNYQLSDPPIELSGATGKKYMSLAMISGGK